MSKKGLVLRARNEPKNQENLKKKSAIKKMG